jgi:hypothetical protein
MRAYVITVLASLIGITTIKSQVMTLIDVNIDVEPHTVRVTGFIPTGSFDRIEEYSANDTVNIDIYHDWCFLSSVEPYDTTFPITNTYPFDLCINWFRDTFEFVGPSFPCLNDSIEVGTSECLSADQILSTSFESHSNRFKIYPNPSASTIKLDLGLDGYPQNAHYIIRQADGIPIRREKIQELEIDISDLPVGVYILELELDDGLVRRRFVKIPS